MKYVVFLGDGMADTPVKALEGKTPLMVAHKPNIDALAKKSEIGIAKTVPDGMKPGSDTANLSVMGYDPRTCYSGRSPLEALSLGIDMAEDDIAIRCNLVTLSDKEPYEKKTMIDYSAGEISTEEARELIAFLGEKLGTEKMEFFGGLSYRHCLIVHHAVPGEELTPPHDITGKPVKGHLPEGGLGAELLDLQKRSYELLKDHPINAKRREEGKNPANSIWLWGEGTKPALPDFYEKNGVRGAVISAVDLIKGIGKGAGMEVVDVEGATGNVNTNFKAKGAAAIEAFKRGADYVYIHVEAPDESGHQGSLEDKIKSIEKIDEDIVGPVIEYLKGSGEAYHVLVCPDHPTPLATRTHSSDPVPYLIYRSDKETDSGTASYDEETAKSTGRFEAEGFRLIERLLCPAEEILEEGIFPGLITDESGETVSETAGIEDEKRETAPAEDDAAGEEDNAKEDTEDESAAAEKNEGARDTESADDNNTEGKNEDAKDAENSEVAPSDTAASASEDQKEGKKKGGGFGAFFKKHLKFFVILIAALVIAGGLTAGHFISTYHIATVRSTKDLNKALSESRINTIVLKKDVAVEGDLLFTRPVDIDLKKHTLSISGALSVSVAKDLNLGTKKNGKYTNGGRIIANSFQAVGSKELRLFADLSAENATVAAAKFTVHGKIEGDFDVTSGEMTLNGAAKGVLTLSEETALSVYGSAEKTEGGLTVSVHKGATAEEVSGAATCYVYEGATVSSVRNAGNYYFVKKLSTPDKITVIQEGDDFYCYVSEVIGATSLAVSINGADQGSVDVTGGTVRFKLEGLVPGKQDLSVTAKAEGDPRFTESDPAYYSFNFSTKLSSPTIAVSEADGKVKLTISAVKYAEYYEYFVDGAKHMTTMSELEADITDLVTEGGVHVIECVAKSNDKYFTDSNKVMASYVTYATILTPSPTAAIEDGKVTFTWEETEGVTDYYVTYGENNAYLKGNSISFDYDEGSSFSIKAIGGGYYLSGGTERLSASAIAALTE